MGITLPTEYCLLDTLDTTIPTHTFCTDVRREKLMLNLMLIPRLMLMLLHGTEFMDTGLLDILVTTIHMDIPSHILCMAARREPLKLNQNHLLNPMLILKLMLKPLPITGFMDIGPDITPGTTTKLDIHTTGMENKSTRERLLSVKI